MEKNEWYCFEKIQSMAEHTINTCYGRTNFRDILSLGISAGFLELQGIPFPQYNPSGEQRYTIREIAFHKSIPMVYKKATFHPGRKLQE